MNKPTTRKIKVLIIAKSVDGGTGTFLLNLLAENNKFTKSDFKIKILVLEKPNYRLLKKIKSDIFLLNNTYPKYYRFTYKNILRFYDEIVWVRKKISSFGPEIILSIDIHSNILAILSKIIWFRRLKIIATTHIDLLSTLLDKSSVFMKTLLIYSVKIFYDRADILVGVSNGVSRNLKRNFRLKKKVITIYNGVNIPLLHSKIDLRVKNKIIITVTRLDKQKDVKNLINAFYLLQKQLLGVKLWILGDGPERNELELLVEKYQLKGKVLFFGWINNIDKYLLRAGLFVLSSKREGLPYSLLEAMKFGLPIVSTNSPYGPKEILDKGKYGILVPVKRPDIMHKSIYLLLTDRKKYIYYSNRSRERSRYFSINKTIEEYNNLFITLSKK